MEELTIEEKAKRYDERLKRAIAAHKDDDKHIKATIERIFPELKESDDERVRKALIKYFNAYTSYSELRDGVTAGDAIAWLEKRDESAEINPDEIIEECHQDNADHIIDIVTEQRKAAEWSKPYSGVSFVYNNHTWGMCARDNGVEILIDSEIKAFISPEKSFIYPTPLQHNGTSKVGLATEAIKEEKVDNTNMVEPKFKDGDWIVYKETVWKVCNIGLQNYYDLLKINNEVSTRLIKDVDENAHLWTINDAKPGDIIYAESKFNTFDFIAIFSEIKNKNSWEYCSVDSDGDDYSDDLDHWEFDDHKGFVALDRYNFYPATKKQRHLLYQKMKEEGFEWDDEKKELKDL